MNTAETSGEFEFAPVQEAMDQAKVNYEQTGDLKTTLDELIDKLDSIKAGSKDLGGLAAMDEPMIPGNGEE